METASGLAPAAQLSLGAASDSLDDRIVRLGHEGQSAYAIARETGLSEWTIRRVLHENDVPTRAAACSPKSRALSAQRSAKAIALKRDDPAMSAKAIGDLVGVCESQALNYLHGDDIATPRPAPPASGRAAANEATRAVIRERDRYAREHGLWTRQQTTEFLVLRRPSVVYLEREGLLEPSMRLRIGTRTFSLYDPRDVRLFARVRHQSTDHRVLLHRSPESVRRWAKGRGYGRKKADELAARAVERADKEKRLRSGITTADERYIRWRRLYDECRREYPDDSLAAHCRAIFEADWPAHPEDWPRDKYPANRRWPELPDAGFARVAAMRIRNSLQNA